MDDLPHIVTPIWGLSETSTRSEEYAEPFSWVPWVAFTIYMLVAQATLDPKTLNFSGSVLFVATLGVLVIALAYGMQKQQKQWQAEHQPHGRGAVLLELLMYLTGLLMICLVLWRLHH